METESDEAHRARCADPRAVGGGSAAGARPGKRSSNSSAHGLGHAAPSCGASADGLLDDSCRLLSVNEAAAALGFSVDKTRHLVRRGHIPSVRVGRRRYIPARSLAIVTQPTLVSMPEGIGRHEAPKRLVFTPRRRRG